MLQIDEDIIEYQGRAVLLDLCEKIAKTVNRKKAQPYLKQAAKIRYLLKALDNGAYLTATQRDNILQGVISISGMNEFPAAPNLETRERPAILVGGGQSKIQFQDEGVNLGASGTVSTINIVGAGVTVTRSGDVITITIP